ncbi:LAME_0G16798g1_1 [Lachancea meyersii CBS 8951]|uniref:LAME_0G16798g1_1 n=1 Tax=Lachancea meyersii CBS 8951 TaxID=1266667 RepID=A0A1G4KB75_9SACH|nr:LAME_0G16798g1_1 [Lachancea meyersii CBS 8951]
MSQSSTWDPLLFLTLPVTLRKCVYWHLDGQLTRLRLPSSYELFTDTMTESRKTARRKRQAFKLRKKLQKFIELYSYMPDFVNSWLDYMSCLRYDCVVLDYLRVNRELESTLTQLHWIFIDGCLMLGLFSPEGLLQHWCSLEEYKDLVDNDLNLATVVNMEHLNGEELRQLNTQLEKLEVKDLVRQVTFYQDEEIPETAGVRDLISMLESLKGLQTLAVTSNSMFERLVNFHGFRDYPGHTLGYAVRKRVAELEISRCGVLGGPQSLANLERWEAVGKVTFSFLEALDLNQVVLPPHCVWLRLQNVKRLRWWDLQALRTILPSRLLLSGSINETLDHSEAWSKPVVEVLDASELHTCKALLWETLRHLHRIQLIDVMEIEPVAILPLCLYNSGQIQCSGTTDLKRVLYL